MVAQKINGHRIAGYLDHPSLEPVEVIHGNVCRRKVVPNLWPRTTHPGRLPMSMRVEVKTPAGIVMVVCVRFMLIGEYVYASASPVDRAHGEDFMASGAFPVECEVEAETIALMSL